MATYTPTIWIDNETLLNAEHFNHIEQGIKTLYDLVNEKGEFNIYENDGSLLFAHNGSNIFSVSDSSIAPVTDYTVDLGNVDKRFRNIYFTGNLTNGTSIITFNNLLNAIKDITFAVEGDNATLTKTTIANTTSSETIPLATDQNAGLMSPLDVQKMAEMRNEIDALKGQTVRLLYTASTTPTATDIMNFVIASGYTNPDTYPGIAVVVNITYHIWHYYTTLSAFKDDGADVSAPFTPTTPGIIASSNNDGQIYAEADGTGSVVGWDRLLNMFAPLYYNNVIYNIGDVCLHGTGIYQCNTNNTTGTWNENKWNAIQISTLLQQYTRTIPRYNIITILTTDWTLNTNTGKYECSINSGLDLSGNNTQVEVSGNGFINSGYWVSFGINGISYDDNTNYINFEAQWEPTEDVEVRVKVEGYYGN